MLATRRRAPPASFDELQRLPESIEVRRNLQPAAPLKALQLAAACGLGLTVARDFHNYPATTVLYHPHPQPILGAHVR